MALKSNDNLDLESYNPFLKDFGLYSDNLIDVKNIFTSQRNDLAENKADRNIATRKISNKRKISES